MSRFVPFQGVDRRIVMLRLILLTALFLGMIASAPLWINSHSFPLLPITSWFPILPSPWDKALFLLMLASLVAAVWFHRPAVIFLLVAALFRFFEDQNRGQPWFYMYCVMMLLSLLPDTIALAACRVALSVAYIWSGIQKFNSRFFKVVPEMFVPAGLWHMPASLIEALRTMIAAAPFLELAVGLLLWVSITRPISIGAAIALHLAALVFLGPLANNYNWVVWPWNLAMIGLVWTLFAGRRPLDGRPAEKAAAQTKSPSPKKQLAKKGKAIALLEQTFTKLRLSKLAMTVLALYSLLPILSYSGRWDSYFSFCLYSENAAVANVFVSEAFRERLPSPLRSYVQRFPAAYDPQRQGPFTFSFQAWGYEELHVPPISEVRNFRSLFRFLRSYAKDPADLRMIVGQRSGPVLFFQGEEVEFLTPK
jgi:hypothetical protein